MFKEVNATLIEKAQNRMSKNKNKDYQEELEDLDNEQDRSKKATKNTN